MDAGASSSDDHDHHHHAAHQHNNSGTSAVKGKYSGSDRGESEDWNDSTSSSSEEEDSSSSSGGDVGSGDSVTEGCGEGDGKAEGEASKKKSNKGIRNGTDGAGKGMTVQKEKKRREKDTSSDAKVYWNNDMVCRFLKLSRVAKINTTQHSDDSGTGRSPDGGCAVAWHGVGQGSGICGRRSDFRAMQW